MLETTQAEAVRHQGAELRHDPNETIMHDLVVIIDDAEHGDRHRESHPHELHIYSEIDKVDHPFRVKPEATVGHVVAQFYKRTEVAPTPLDRFKCESNSRDVSVYPNLTLQQLAHEAHCSGDTWIFTNEPIHISLSGRDITVTERKLCFEEIVRLRFGAYDSAQTIAYTVTYKNADENQPDGELVIGKCVRVKDGTRIHVKRTNRS